MAGCSPTTTRIDVNISSGVPNGAAARPRLSANGRWVVFESASTDLVGAGVDTNGVVDVFVRDRCVVSGGPLPACTPTTERVSVASDGTQSDEHSGVSSISDDGRYVAFASAAHTLNGVNTWSLVHIYARDRSLGVTLPIDVALTGGEAPGSSAGPRISGDGRYVMFSSLAADIISGDINNNQDVFVRDLQRGVTDTVSLDFFGSPLLYVTNGIDISRDGRYVLVQHADELCALWRATACLRHLRSRSAHRNH